MNSSHWAEIAILVCMSNTSPLHNNCLWKGTCIIEKSHCNFKACQVFANTFHFCVVQSQPSLYRSKRSRRKPSSPLHLFGYAIMTSNTHKRNVVCKAGFEGVWGTSLFCHKFLWTRQRCLTFFWLPCHTNIQHRSVSAALVQKRHILVQTWCQITFPGEISKVSLKPQLILWIKP